MIDWLRQLANRVLSLFRGTQFDRDLDEEISLHLDLAIQENLRRGMSPEEARRQALLRFGSTARAKEQHRDARGLPALDNFIQDLRYAFRTLYREPAFAVIAIVILALGIGANIAVFSVVNTILLRPLPFHDAHELAWLSGNNGVGGLSDKTYRVDVYEEFQRNNRSFQQVTAFVPYYALSETKLLGAGEPQPVSFVWVAGNFFNTLGIQPIVGRLFTPEESVRGGSKVIILSYPFWQRQFAANPAIVGQAINLNNESVTVVGILPATFDFGAVFAPGSKMDFFRPVFMDDIRSWGHMLAVVGRLHPGVTAEQAQAEANILFPHLKDSANPDWSTDIKTAITSLKDFVSGKLHRSLIVLWYAVGLILLIVCVNLSNLLLARTAARSKEFAVRGALGASRGRLMRQLFTESLVLSSAGAILGLGLAAAIIAFLAQQESLALPLLSSLKLDMAALVWTLLIAMTVAVICGVAPGLNILSSNLQSGLKDSGHGTSAGRKHDRLRSVLVISEVALACVLLVGAGLLLRSFLRVLDVDLGFEPRQAAVIKIDYNDGGKRAQRGVVLQEILGRMKAIPGVESAAVADLLPLERNRSWNLVAKGKAYSPQENYDAFVYIVTPGYFEAMGMRLLEGRDFTWQDKPDSENVIVINQAAARREWPGENAIGRVALGIGNGETRVVGVIADVRESSVEDSSSPAVYVPVTQGEPEGAELVVRTKIPLDVLSSSVMSSLRELNPNQPATQFRPVQKIVDHATSPRRFFVVLVTAFAGLGLLLASLGIYGVISYSVTRQTQEIGIRMALGATSTRVQLKVMGKTLRLALIGVALGTIASVAVARWIASLLFGTTPTDPVTFSGVILLLVCVAVIAGYIPARRASRINPIVAVRGN